jgi:hypothetical protein
MEILPSSQYIMPGDARAGTRQRHKKPLILRASEAMAAFGVFETTIPNTIDALRDGTSFPEDCGEERDIGTVLDSVKSGSV